jgi:hypothetical protein
MLNNMDFTFTLTSGITFIFGNVIDKHASYAFSVKSLQDYHIKKARFKGVKVQLYDVKDLNEDSL